MAEKSTAELSPDTWRFFNQKKAYPREPIGEVIDRYVERLHSADFREQLASTEHVQWAHWTDYMLHNMSTENAERWALQVKTPYNELSESEKESDREWADRVLAVIRGEQV